jgi:hypothetical protein
MVDLDMDDENLPVERAPTLLGMSQIAVMVICPM